jgi:hypothetical protein
MLRSCYCILLFACSVCVLIRLSMMLAIVSVLVAVLLCLSIGSSA